jgi:hypothetical protein
MSENAKNPNKSRLRILRFKKGSGTPVPEIPGTQEAIERRLLVPPWRPSVNYLPGELRQIFNRNTQ